MSGEPMDESGPSIRDSYLAKIAVALSLDPASQPWVILDGAKAIMQALFDTSKERTALQRENDELRAALVRTLALRCDCPIEDGYLTHASDCPLLRVSELSARAALGEAP